MSGGKRPPGSGWSPRTPASGQDGTRRDRANRDRVRGRLLARACLRHLGDQDLDVVATQPFRVVGAGAGGGLRAPAGRPRLRADPRRDRARLGPGRGLGATPPSRLPPAPGYRPQPATEVDISFTGRAGVTVVTIVHRGWDRLGADAPAWRDRNLGGWNGLLPHTTARRSAPGPGRERGASARPGPVRSGWPGPRRRRPAGRRSPARPGTAAGAGRSRCRWCRG
jgi:hypothetical protein